MIARWHMRTSAIFAGLALAICLAFSPVSAAADDSAISNTPAIAHDPLPAFDNRPIHRDSAAASPDSAKSPVPDVRSTAFNPARVLLVLTGIVGLILILRSAMRRFFPGAVAHRATRVMKVLSRTLITPRQNLLLIQIGKRLVVVGDSGTQLNPLCQIKDPREVESILSELREESAAGIRRFDLFFGKARKGFDQDLAAQELPKISEDAEPETPAVDSAPRPEARFDETHEIIDPSLQQTRKEISGLTEKVRDLARQLGNS